MRSATLRAAFGCTCLFVTVNVGCESILGIRETAGSTARDSSGGAANGTRGGAVDDGGSPGEGLAVSHSVGGAGTGGSPAYAGGGSSETSGSTRPVERGTGGAGSASGTGGAVQGGNTSLPMRDGGAPSGGQTSSGDAGGTSTAGESAGAGAPDTTAGGGQGGVAPSVAGPTGLLVASDGRCLEIQRTDGKHVTDPHVVVGPCTGDPQQQWSRDGNSRFKATLFDDAYLEALLPGEGAGGETSAEAFVVVDSLGVPASVSQIWTFEGVHVVNDAGLCLDTPSDNFSDLTHLQVYGCHPGDEQAWSLSTLEQIQHGSFCVDLPQGDTIAGTPLEVYLCNDPVSDNQRFALAAGKLVSLEDSAMCVAVAGDPTLSPTPVDLEPCDPEPGRPTNQSFRVHGPIQNQSRCLVLVGTDSVGFDACDGGDEQAWDWYF